MNRKRLPVTRPQTHLTQFDAEERTVATRMHDLFLNAEQWLPFGKAWQALVFEYYRSRKASDRSILDSRLYKYGEELEDKLKLAAGAARPPDYRDQLQEICRQYPTRKQFCEATGISEDMLSHVIHNRKDLSIAALSTALGRIGYKIQFVRSDEG